MGELQKWAPTSYEGCYKSTYRGEISLAKPSYFWPFIGVITPFHPIYKIYNDRRISSYQPGWYHGPRLRCDDLRAWDLEVAQSVWVATEAVGAFWGVPWCCCWGLTLNCAGNTWNYPQKMLKNIGEKMLCDTLCGSKMIKEIKSLMLGILLIWSYMVLNLWSFWYLSFKTWANVPKRGGTF